MCSERSCLNTKRLMSWELMKRGFPENWWGHSFVIHDSSNFCQSHSKSTQKKALRNFGSFQAASPLAMWELEVQAGTRHHLTQVLEKHSQRLRGCPGQTGMQGANRATFRRWSKQHLAWFNILDASGLQFSIPRYIYIPRYTQLYFQTLPTLQYLQLQAHDCCFSCYTKCSVFKAR